MSSGITARGTLTKATVHFTNFGDQHYSTIRYILTNILNLETFFVEIIDSICSEMNSLQVLGINLVKMVQTSRYQSKTRESLYISTLQAKGNSPGDSG